MNVMNDKNVFLFLLLAVFVLLAGCGNQKTDAMLAEVENIMYQKPDSVAYALVLLNKNKNVMNNGNRRQIMKYQLLRAEAMNKCVSRMDTIGYVDELIHYYIRHGTKMEIARAYYVAGAVCRDKGQSPMAIENMLKAAKCISNSNSKSDRKLLCRIYGQMADIFGQQNYFQKEIEMWSKVRDTALSCDDTLMNIYAKGRICDVYYILGDKEKSVPLAKDVYRQYKAVGLDDYAAASVGVLIDWYLSVGNLPKAKYYIDEYENNSGLVDKNGHVEAGHEMYYYYLALYAEKKGDYRNAISLCNRLLHADDDLENVENAYRVLLSVYEKIGNADSMVRYSRLFADANGSVCAKKTLAEVSRTYSLYNYTEMLGRAKEKSEENELLWFSLFSSLAIGSLLLMAMSIAYKQYKKKKLRQIAALNIAHALEKNSYQSEIQSLNADANKLNAEVRHLEKVVRSYSGGIEEKWTLEDRGLQHFVIRQLHLNVVKLQDTTPKEWLDFENAMNEMFPKFSSFLSNKNLTEQELKVAQLVRANFTTSEMVVLLRVSKQRISNVKSTLNEKLFGRFGARGFEKALLAIT